ncbi:PTS sugar transporter subunit IIA [Pseudostreptobacillus hongkongensis]|uniref:PTS sugar transporter subunit IIA n=1 Tax=Pseudostreptobacillus hongkongensis TaxID=1162717 RepID=UPI0028D15AB8|nr:PTS sugar transporter subunit IIA [Pseudostreptobacillus hongkongensis]
MDNIYKNIYKINLDLKSKTKNALLKEMFKEIKDSEYILDKDKAFEDLLDREIIGSTGIGKAVAIPHAKTDSVTKIVMGVGIHKEGIDYESIDEEKVNLVFMFLTPNSMSQEYLTLLARISRFAQDKSFRETLLNASSEEEVIEIIKKMEIK